MYVISFTMTGTSWECVRDWQEQAKMLAESLSGQLFQNPKFPRVILITSTDLTEEALENVEYFIESVPTPHAILMTRNVITGEICGVCLGKIFRDANRSIRYPNNDFPRLHTSPESKRRT